MNYELAKQLKDTGFPQDTKHWYSHDGVSWNLDDGAVTVSAHGYVSAPTLSELIEACGEAFGGLIRRKNGDWNAATPVLKIVDEYRNPLMDADGSTPEEAVAGLWLALNRKP